MLEAVLKPSTPVMFGLIMVLTLMSSLSIARGGYSDIRSMLLGALGCNLGWGIIDATCS
jgi:hypothetical protein